MGKFTGNIDHSVLCKECGKKMVKKYHLVSSLSNPNPHPPIRRFDFWCNCGNQFYGGTEPGLNEDDMLRLKWENANKLHPYIK